MYHSGRGTQCTMEKEHFKQIIEYKMISLGGKNIYESLYILKRFSGDHTLGWLLEGRINCRREGINETRFLLYTLLQHSGRKAFQKKISCNF